MRRWIYEQRTLPRLLSQRGVDGILLLGGFKIFLSHRPQVAVWQNAHIWTPPAASHSWRLTAYIALQKILLRATVSRVERNVFLSRDSTDRGTSTEKDLVNSVTYTYAFPVHPKPMAKGRPPEPPPLRGELAATIQRAAQAVKNSATSAGLPFSKLTVLIQYGVKWHVDKGGNVTYSFVTIGAGADASKNTVQAVRLEFEK